ncbi:nucleotidyltransferase [Serratia marcescens]|nr:nucleotidyltransferase [Serratia marcescens]ELQ9442353.1 nucleotidyltransferase [Serratia marcescens]ELT5563113.1 nucleotidyltransferase [Serratia marcescens]
MLTSEMFNEFLQNLKIPTERLQAIATHYKNATRRLNLTFRGKNNGYSHRLKVGSAGRRTAVKKTSDLDMLYIMPSSLKSGYGGGDNPQRRLLRDVKEALKVTFSTQEVKIDRLVVQVVFDSFHIEIQPVFECEDGSFEYPDTKANQGEGGWRMTKPRLEIDEMRRFYKEKSRNLHNLCRMLRAWKNRNTVNMGGLLIDTLVWRFLQSTSEYDHTGAVSYGFMCRDMFGFLKDETEKQYYKALGSGQNVKVYKAFNRQSKRAYEKSCAAIEAYDNGYHNKCHSLWREVFGLSFPQFPVANVESINAAEGGIDKTSMPGWRNTEEFTDERFSDVDIGYPLEINCWVSQDGFRDKLLRHVLTENFWHRIPHKRKLRFEVNAEFLDKIPAPYQIYWKVLNRGPEAERKDCIRGQIVAGTAIQREQTSFAGGHKVWCYIVKNNIVVAQASVDIPIE